MMAVLERSATRSSRAVYGVYALFLFACYAVVRVYTLGSTHYLVLADYMAGQERLPFQKRMLPMLLLEQMEKIPLPRALLEGRKSIFAHQDLLCMFVLDLSAFVIAAMATLWLYRRVAPHGRFGLLVFPIFIYVTIWTYVMHTEQNYYYQYDLMSLAFFTVGLCLVYARRFTALLAVVAIGSLNRETTLFLIVIFVLDGCVPAIGATVSRPAWRTLPWKKIAVLLSTWLVIKGVLDARYALNDRSEDYFRLWENLRRLGPQHWAELLGGCGFLLPIVFLLRRRIPDSRIALWIWVVPCWVGVMFVYGVVIETRIYGELSGLVAVASALLLDVYLGQTPRADASHPAQSAAV